MSNKKFTAYDLVVYFISLISYLVDVGSDIALVVVFFLEGHQVWGALTLGFVALATFLMQIFSFVWHATDGTLNWKTFSIHILFLAPLHRYIDVLRYGFKARRTRSPDDYDAVFRANNDVCLLRLMECFAESAPQLILQLYIILKFHHFNWIIGISCVFSLTSVAWAMTAYTDGLRLAFKDEYRRKWIGMTVYTCCQIAMIASRIVAIVVFATVFEAWIFLPIGIHWIMMTFWVTLQEAEFGQTTCEKRLFNSVSGLIYIFCFLNLKDGHARWRLLAYHMVMLAENSLFVLLWFLYRPDTTPVWLEITTLVTVFGGFVIGGVLMMSYYSSCHPTGIRSSGEKKEAAHWFKRLKSIQEKPKQPIFERSPSSARVAEWLHASMNLSTDDRKQEVNFDPNALPSSSEVPDILSTGILDNSNNIVFSCTNTYYQFKEPSIPSTSMLQDWTDTLDSARNSHISASSTRRLIKPSSLESLNCQVNHGYRAAPELHEQNYIRHDSKFQDSDRRCCSVASSHVSANSERAFAITGVHDSLQLIQSRTSSRSDVNNGSGSFSSSYCARDLSPLDASKLWDESQSRLKIQENISKSLLMPLANVKHDSFYSSPEFKSRELSAISINKSRNDKVPFDSSISRFSKRGNVSTSKESGTDTLISESRAYVSPHSTWSDFVTDASITCLNSESCSSESRQNFQLTTTHGEFNDSPDTSPSFLKQKEIDSPLKTNNTSELSNFFGDISSVNHTQAGRSRFLTSSTSDVDDISQSKINTFPIVTPLHDGKTHLSTSYYEESNAQSPYSPSSHGNHVYAHFKKTITPPEYIGFRQSSDGSELPPFNYDHVNQSNEHESSVFSSNASTNAISGQDSSVSIPHRSDSGLMAESASSRRYTSSSSDQTSNTSGKNTDDSGYSVAKTIQPIKPFKLDKFRFASDSQYPTHNAGVSEEETRLKNGRSKSLSSLAFRGYYKEKLESESDTLHHALSTPYLHHTDKSNSYHSQNENSRHSIYNNNSSLNSETSKASSIGGTSLKSATSNKSSVRSSLPGLSYLLSDEEDSLSSENSRLSLLSRKPISDTPWKSDYCENQPMEHTVDLYGDYQNLDFVRLNQPQTLPSESMKNVSKSVGITPVRVDQMTDSPHRFGRSVDLFNRAKWRSSLDAKRRASSLAYLALNPDLMVNDYGMITEMTQSPYKFRSRLSDPSEGHRSAFVPVKSERRKSHHDKENQPYYKIKPELNDMVLQLTESPYKFRSSEQNSYVPTNPAKVGKYSADFENGHHNSRHRQRRKSKRPLSSPRLNRRSAEITNENYFAVSGRRGDDMVTNGAIYSSKVSLRSEGEKKEVKDVMNPCYMYSDTDSEDDIVIDKFSDITCNTSTSSDDVYQADRYFTFTPKSSKDIYQIRSATESGKRPKSRGEYRPCRKVLRSIENTPNFSPIQEPDIVGSNKVKEKMVTQPYVSTPKITGGLKIDSSNAGTFVKMSIQNEDSTIQV